MPHSTDCGYTISIHALREEGDTPANIGSGRPCDFYPRPPRGGRRLPSCKSLTCRTFLSTPSARRATFSQASTCRSKSFLSTPSARRATAEPCAAGCGPPFLSTPSARRATVLPDGWEVDDPYFYPRPPRGGRLRHSSKLQQNKGYFYPRPPRGGRPVRASCTTFHGHFYPRPPRGGRPVSRDSSTITKKFLSTPSARRATLL